MPPELDLRPRPALHAPPAERRGPRRRRYLDVEPRHRKGNRDMPGPPVGARA